MNEECMDVVLEEAWGAEGLSEEGWDAEECADLRDGEFEIEEGEVGADNTGSAPTESEPEQRQETQSSAPEVPAQQEPAVQPAMVGEHPSMQQVRESARKRDLARFIATYPGVRAADIPKQVWDQVSRGVPLVSAYALHENARLKAQLAAERQNRANQRRTPGGLGSNSGGELDELDLMWAEED